MMRSIIRKFQDESGQAVIEYVLLLTVVVGIVLGGLYQLNTAFRSWANSYFGEYLACLIESGELPSLGGGASGECDQLFKSFSIADGRPLVGKAIGDGDGDSSGSNGDENDSGASGGGSSSGVTSSRGASNASFGSGGQRRFRVNSKGGAGGEEGDEGKSNSTGIGGVTDLSGYQSEGRAVRIPLESGYGLRGGRRIDKDEKKETKTKIGNVEKGQVERRGPELIRVERKVASQNTAPEIEEFSFGDLFRYLIIAAIVIAIIFFIGGQMLQVSKSMD